MLRSDIHVCCYTMSHCLQISWESRFIFLCLMNDVTSNMIMHLLLKYQTPLQTPLQCIKEDRSIPLLYTGVEFEVEFGISKGSGQIWNML